MSRESKKTRNKTRPNNRPASMAQTAKPTFISQPATNRPAAVQSYDAQEYVKKDLKYSGLAAAIVILVLIVSYLLLH